MSLFKHQLEALGYKPVKDFDGYYINNKGEMYSIRKRIPNQPQGAIKLKPIVNFEGYLIVSLYRNNKRHQAKIHRLVAEVFLPNRPEDKYLVRHLDDNKQNNSVENLVWGNPAENSKDMIKNGHSLSGEKHLSAKLTKSQILNIRELATSTLTQQAIADRFGITKGHVNNIIKKRVWANV